MIFKQWLHLGPEHLPANMPLSERIESYLKPNARVLDLGCGDGRLYNYFSSRNCLYYGIDANSVAIEAAKRKYHDVTGVFQVANAETLDLPDSFFDIIIAQGTLACMDLEGRLKTIAKMKRISNRDAIVHITELDLQDYPSFYQDQMHLTGEYGTVMERPDGTRFGYTTHHFSKKELMELLSKDWEILVEEHPLLTTRNKNQYKSHRMILKKRWYESD